MTDRPEGASVTDSDSPPTDSDSPPTDSLVTDSKSPVTDSDSPDAIARTVAVIHRELQTVIRTRAYLALAGLLLAVSVGVVVAGGSASAGYVPAVADLLTPMELLVPLVAFAFGYRALLDGVESGEQAVLRTYPLRTWEYVLGVFLGRAAGVAGTIILAFGAAGLVIAFVPADVVTVYASHRGADSPLLFARFVVLTIGFGGAVLAVALAVSAAARSTRSALALTGGALLVLVIGIDLVIVDGLGADWLDEGLLGGAVAASPNGAFRGLVLETAIGVAGDAPRAVSPVVAVVSLGVWTVLGLVVAILALDRR